MLKKKLKYSKKPHVELILDSQNFAKAHWKKFLKPIKGIIVGVDQKKVLKYLHTPGTQIIFLKMFFLEII